MNSNKFDGKQIGKFSSFKYKDIIFYSLLIISIIFPIFGHLESLTIRIWDEARLAINAYEMYHNGNILVTHFEGSPDLWNTKPPLLIWMQVIGMKLFGTNELAVRLPSAIAAFFTCIALLLFLKKYFKNNWFGIITVMVLITSYGYINVHASRTGDYDSLLTLFTTSSGLLFFTYCHKKDNKYLYYFFIATALAVLTKSVTGLLFMPALVIYSILDKQFIPLLKNKHFYFGILLFIGILACYYIPREIVSPGYLKAVQENELGGRYLNTLETHQHSFWFYYSNFINYQFSYWHLFVPCGFLLAFSSKDERIKKLGLFTFLMLIVFFLVISTAQTKLEWYDVPLYPFLAISVAFFVHFIIELLTFNNFANKSLNFNPLPIICFFLLIITPYLDIIDKTYKKQEQEWNYDFYRMSNYLREAINNKRTVANEFIVLGENDYKAHIQFYTNILNEKGNNIGFKLPDQLEVNDVILVHQDEIKQEIEENYNVEIIEVYHNITKYKINERPN